MSPARLCKCQVRISTSEPAATSSQLPSTVSPFGKAAFSLSSGWPGREATIKGAMKGISAAPCHSLTRRSKLIDLLADCRIGRTSDGDAVGEDAGKTDVIASKGE